MFAPWWFVDPEIGHCGIFIGYHAPATVIPRIVESNDDFPEYHKIQMALYSNFETSGQPPLYTGTYRGAKTWWNDLSYKNRDAICKYVEEKAKNAPTYYMDIGVLPEWVMALSKGASFDGLTIEIENWLHTSFRHFMEEPEHYYNPAHPFQPYSDNTGDGDLNLMNCAWLCEYSYRKPLNSFVVSDPNYAIYCKPTPLSHWQDLLISNKPTMLHPKQVYDSGMLRSSEAIKPTLQIGIDNIQYPDKKDVTKTVIQNCELKLKATDAGGIYKIKLLVDGLEKPILLDRGLTEVTASYFVDIKGKKIGEFFLIQATAIDMAGNESDKYLVNLIVGGTKLKVDIQPDELQDGKIPDGKWQYRKYDEITMFYGPWSDPAASGIFELIPGIYELQAKDLTADGWEFDNPSNGNMVVDLTASDEDRNPPDGGSPPLAAIARPGSICQKSIGSDGSVGKEVTFIYKQIYKDLTVYIEPPEVQKTARWFLANHEGLFKHCDQLPLQDNDQTTVCFTEVAGYKTPEDIEVTMAQNQTVTGTYVPDTSKIQSTTLKVTLLPEEINQMTGWKTSVDTAETWHKSGDIVKISPPGYVDVYFKPVEYWIAPQDQKDVDMRISREITATYINNRDTLSPVVSPGYLYQWVVKGGGRWKVSYEGGDTGWLAFDQAVPLNAGVAYTVSFAAADKFVGTPEPVNGVMQNYPTYAYASYMPERHWQFVQSFPKRPRIVGEHIVSDNCTYKVENGSLQPTSDPLPLIYTRTNQTLNWLNHECECGRRGDKAYKWPWYSHSDTGSGWLYGFYYTTDCVSQQIQSFNLPWHSSIDWFSIGEHYSYFNMAELFWFLEPPWGPVLNDHLVDQNALVGTSGLNTSLICNNEYHLVGSRFHYHGTPGIVEFPNLHKSSEASGIIELIHSSFPYDQYFFEIGGSLFALIPRGTNITDLYKLGSGGGDFAILAGENFVAANGKWRLFHEGCWRDPGIYKISDGCKLELEYKVDEGYDIEGQSSFITNDRNDSVIVKAIPKRNICLYLNPSDAQFRFSTDPKWRWRSSGCYPFPSDGNPATQYVTIYFKDMPDWENPGPYSFIPYGTSEISLNISYKPKRYLTVRLQPAGATLCGAKWRVSGYTDWKASGDTVELSDGFSAAIEYYGLSSSSGWINPMPQVEEVVMNESKVLERTYGMNAKTLKVLLGPDEYAVYQGRWRLKGSEVWHQSGETMEVRSYSQVFVEFMDIQRRTTPGTVTCTMSQNQTVWGYYTGYHKLQVYIIPQEAIAAGARWRFAGGEWHSSSDAYDLAEGDTYEIEFAAASGDFAAPDPVKGTMEAQVQIVTAEYSHSGSYCYQLTVMATPEAAVACGAGWRLTGEEDWHFSGTGIRLSVGSSYEIEFKPVFGYQTPDSASGTIESSDLTIRPEYTPAYGLMSVTTTPGKANQAGAAWKLSGEVEWRQSGTTVEMRIGSGYAIDFKPIQGWTPPKQLTGTVWSENTEQTGNYCLIGSTLCVQIMPERLKSYASWRLTGEDWQSSGASVIIPVGATFELEFADYQGFDTPAHIKGRKSSWSETVNAVYEPEAGSWKLVTDTVEFPQRFDFAALTFSSEIYVIAGRHDTQELADVWKSSNGVNWTCETSSAAFGARSLHSCAVYDGKIWLVGGWDGSVELGDVWASSDGADWTLVTYQTAFGTRRNTHLVEHDGVLWCFGGRRDSLELTDVWKSINGSDWTLVTAETGVSFASATTIISYHGSFYLIGGSEQNGCWSSPDGEHWTSIVVSAGFGNRYGAAVTIYNNLIWSAGGLEFIENGISASDDAWHSTDCSVWEEDTGKAGFGLRYGHVLVSFQDKIWLLGGSDYSGTQNDVWCFEATKEVLSVRFHPVYVVNAGAFWRVDGGEWISNCGTLEVPASRLFTLECKDIYSWIAPAQQSLVMPSCNMRVDVTYETSLRPVVVLISPDQAATDGMKWRLSGETAWHDSGSFELLDSGSPCTVECIGSVLGWNKPDPVSLTVDESGSTVSVTCTPVHHTLTVNLGPDEAVQSGAAWRSVGAEEWRFSNCSVVVQAGKAYILEFKATPRHLTPAGLSGIMLDHDASITVIYSEQTCSLTVNLAPEKAIQLGAGWKLSGESEWRNSGTSAAIQIGDTYSVEFSPLSDLNRPASISGTINYSLTIEPLYTDNFWDVASANAGFQPRYGAAAIALSSEILLTGGSNGMSALSDVWHTQTGFTWEVITAEAGFGNRFLHSLLVLNGEAWLLCGTNGSNIYGDVWHSGNGSDWQCATEEAAFGPRYGQAAASFEGKLWVIGGNSPTGLKADVWYSENGVDWNLTNATPGFSARYGAALAAYNGKLWLIGGNDGSPLSDVWSSEDGSSWTVVSQSAIPARYYHKAIGYGGSLWVIGGFLSNGNSGLESDFYFSTDGVDWTVHHDIEGFSARALPCLLEKSARLWLFTGIRPSGPMSDVLYSADTVGYQCLTVEITPQAAVAAGACWKLASDSAWRQSGASALIAEYSSYEIMSKNIPHWIAPESVSGNIGTAELSISRDYIPIMKSLTVMFEPVAAVNDGAAWKLSGESEWRSTSAVTLQEGIYTIEAMDVNGWVTPQAATIDLEQDSSETFIYQLQKYQLSVSLSPSLAVNEGAAWRFSGEEAWRQAGNVKLARGTDYAIEYRDVSGWSAPDISSGSVGYENIQIVSEYAAKNYSVFVTIDPSWAKDAGAMWRLVGDSVWHPSEDTVNLPHDSEYAVEFSTTEGWIKPETVSGTVGTAEINLAMQYKPNKYVLSVLIGPDLAVSEYVGWRIVGEERWRTAGDLLEIENHTHYQVEFRDVQGWSNHGWQVGDIVNSDVTLTEECIPSEYELSMNLNPEKARNAGARWRILPDGEWKTCQDSLTLTHGTRFSLEFSDLNGWVTPQIIDGIMPAESTVLDGDYAPIMHAISAVIQPDESRGATWSLASDMIPRNSGDAAQVQQGDDFQVIFGERYGWIKPDAVTGKVGAEDLTITGEYMPQNQRLCLQIEPQSAIDQGAMWRLGDSTELHYSGIGVDLRRGTSFEIFLSDIIGFSTPASVTGEIGEDDCTLTASYTPIMHTCSVVILPRFFGDSFYAAFQ